MVALHVGDGAVGEFVDERRGVLAEHRDFGYPFDGHHGGGEVVSQRVRVGERACCGVDVDHRHVSGVGVAASRFREDGVDRVGVADVEVAVRLGREAGDDRRMAPAADIRGDDLADEVGAFGGSLDAQRRGNPATE